MAALARTLPGGSGGRADAGARGRGEPTLAPLSHDLPDLVDWAGHGLRGAEAGKH